MALSDCSRQVVWMHTLLGELGYHLKPIPICGDNQGLIFIACNPVTKKRSKHIDICYHYIREVVERKLAEIFFIDGDKNPADLCQGRPRQRCRDTSHFILLLGVPRGCQRCTTAIVLESHEERKGVLTREFPEILSLRNTG